MLAWQGCIECPAIAELSRIPPAISGGVSTGDAEYHPDPNEHTDGRGTRLPGALGNRLDPEPLAVPGKNHCSEDRVRTATTESAKQSRAVLGLAPGHRGQRDQLPPLREKGSRFTPLRRAG